MILNIFHRPDNQDRRHLYEMQQRLCHERGLRTTIFVTVEAMNDPVVLDLIRRDAQEYGDEIGLSFHGLSHPEIANIVGYGQEAVWLYSMDHKQKVISHLVSRFEELFGQKPTTAAAYHFDSSSLSLLMKAAPAIEAVVAGCFEEGVRVFHGCNHSWYLFNEGMPWNPWYPSATHTLRPAATEDDAAGVVAVPHLMRDMVLSYEGRNDFWATHPPNVMRGMGNDGENCPYDRNLIDIFRWQEKFNNGYSYCNTFVSTAWLDVHHAIDDPPEVAQSLYRQQLDYFAELKENGELHDTTLHEFAIWFKKNRPIGGREVFFAKELIYGSKKHYFWYIDSSQRALIDVCQGGSIGDLRPYAGRVPVQTGPDNAGTFYGTYPYLIQSQHRTGLPNHFQDGARSTAFVTQNGESVDMAELPTTIADVEVNDDVVVTLAPVDIQLGTDEIRIVTIITFRAGGKIIYTRRFSGNGTLTLSERVKLAPGRIEYPEMYTDATLYAGAEDPYLCRFEGKTITAHETDSVAVTFPSLTTRYSLGPADGQSWEGTANEGHMYSPYVTLTLMRTVEPEEETSIWQKIELQS